MSREGPNRRRTDISGIDSGRGPRRLYAPEILRLEGELRRLLPSPATGEIEQRFHTALALARDRSAKSLELRVAVALARLWCAQGKRAEASDLITPVYNWFTEGHDLQDLQSGRNLIDDLAHPTLGHPAS